METLSVKAPRAVTLKLPRSEGRRAPLYVLAACLCLAMIGAALVATHVTAFALDETLIQQSAVHYTHDFPHSLFHDLDARATNRLYPLVLSIPFRLFSGANAIRIDRVISVLLFMSAAIPIYLLARVILRSRWACAAVAGLSVVVPWLTLTSALFTENLSYPLFWWMVLAACGAVWRASAFRDVLVLFAIALLVGTRVQFAAVFIGYVLALLTVTMWRTSGSLLGKPERWAAAGLHAVRRYPFALVLLAAASALFVYERSSGHWQSDVERLLGSYSNVVIRNGVAPNMVEGLLIELLALALGVGLVPALVSIPWYGRRMWHPVHERRWVYLFTTGVVLLVFLALTVFSQGGYLGPITEERYFFYVMPVFWIGALAALQDREVRSGEVLAGAVVLAALYGSIPFLSPLTSETAFLAPVESVVPHVLGQRMLQLGLTGLTIQDALALLVLLAGVATAFIWSRHPRLQIGWTVGVAASVQLLITGYAYAVIDGKVQGIPGRTVGAVPSLGWVDRYAHAPDVAWLQNVSIAAPGPLLGAPTNDQQRTTLFWNSRLTSWVDLPQIALPAVEWPLSALPGIADLSVDLSNGRLKPASSASALDEVVGSTDSPYLQLYGDSLAHSPDGVLTLTRLSRPAHANWLAVGLQPDGYIAAGTPVHLFAFAQMSNTAQRAKITLTVAPAPVQGAATSLSVRMGHSHQRVRLTGGSSLRHVDLFACFPAKHVVASGSMATLRTIAIAGGRNVAGMLQGVAVSQPSTTGRC